MVDQIRAKEKIAKLIDKYERLTPQRKKSYNEADTRRDFIMPLFQSLGWDVYNDLTENEVVEEETIISKRIDYAFRLNNITQFILEAKAIPENLELEKWAKQAVEYGWNKGIPWVILSDFEGLKLFNSDWKKDHPQPNLELSYKEYLERFDDLWLLSKKSFENGELDRLLGKFGITAKRESVNERLAEDLVKWRDTLTNNLKQWNTDKEIEVIEESVQRILDRLLFIRVVEDRDIEEKKLWQKFKKWEKDSYEPQNFIKLLVPIFRDFDEKYNSNLFTKHVCEDLDTEGNPFKNILPDLYGSKEAGVKYRFDAINADVLGNVYEQYLGHVQGREGGKSKRKKQGIYYTPTYIVDYIVQNALGKLLEEKSLTEIENIKVLDPACGSGSFLIRAFDVLNEKIKKERGSKDGVQAALRKYRILTNNIYGVDLDPQAVEIARLNLLLKALEPNHKLPMLINNIKNGNSLIEDKNIADKAFVWKDEFNEIMKKGGFDIIIGNPPYIRMQTLDKNEILYFSDHYKSAKGNYDIYILFIEKALGLLRAGGVFGMILPNKFLETKYGEGIRKLLSDKKVVSKVVDFGDYQVFEQATTYTCLLFLQKKRNLKVSYVNAGYYLKKYPVKLINDKKMETFSVSSKSLTNRQWIFTDKENLALMNRIKNGNEILGDLTDRIFQGLKTGADKVFIVELKESRGKYLDVFSNSTGKKHLLEKDLIFPLIKGTEMRPRNILSSSRVIIFPYKSGELLKPNDLRKRYPKVFNYLCENKKDLDKREKGKFSGELFYQYSRNQAINLISKPKIITPDLAPKARFSFDEKGKFCFTGGASGGYGIITNGHIDNYYLLSLLNSKLLDWYLKKVSSKFRGEFYSYEARFIKQLPISIAKNQEILSELSKQIMELNSRLQITTEGSDKWNRLINEIEKLDKQIDQEVYKLYNLTPEEIETVEQA